MALEIKTQTHDFTKTSKFLTLVPTDHVSGLGCQPGTAGTQCPWVGKRAFESPCLGLPTRRSVSVDAFLCRKTCQTESNVLGRFPLPLRRSLIDSVASALLASPGIPGVVGGPLNGASSGPAYVTQQQWIGLQHSATWLTAPAHVWWAMEVIGQGFALPVDEFHKDVVEKCLAVYSGWLLGSLALGGEPENFRDASSDDGKAAKPGLHRLQRAVTSCRPLGIRAGNPLASFRPPGSPIPESTTVLQWFYETCFKHMSQLFQPRTPAFGYK